MKQLHFEQIAILTAPYLHHTLEYALDSIAANGFHSVELWGASPHFCIDDDTPQAHVSRIGYIRRLLQDRDLRLSAFQPEQCRQYPINIASPIPYVRERSIALMEQYLEDTLALGCDRMILTPGWGYVDAPEEEAFQRAAEAIARLAGKAKKLGVKLSMEEMDPLSTLLVRDLPHLHKLLAAVPGAQITACLDTFMAADNKETVEQYYDCFGQIGHVHFADYGNEGYMVPGTGENAGTLLEGQLEALAAHDYAGDLVLSLWGAGYYKDPDAAMRQAIQWIEQSAQIQK